MVIGSVRGKQLRVRPRGHAHRVSLRSAEPPFAVSTGVALLDLASVEQGV
ncbi:MAG: hypothetical protein ACR2OU_15000 [Thermomicrobiales bacterium]